MKRKWTAFWFWPGDFKAVERYLNRQAAKGWELEKPGVFARWKRTERTDLRCCVDMAGPKDKKNPYKQEAYRQICAEGGWELAGLFNQMYFFNSMPGREVVPLQTDPELEQELFRSNYLKTTGRTLILNVITILLCTYNVSLRPWPEGWIKTAVWAMVIAGLLLMVWRVADWFRARVSLRRREKIVCPDWVMWVNWAMVIPVAAVLGFGAAAILGVFGLL